MEMRMAILAATGNTHKMREFKQIFSQVLTHYCDWTIDIYAEQALATAVGVPYVSPEETGTLFAENAMIKAEGIEAFLVQHPEGIPEGYDCTVILADDSGICVDALGGAPGVHSARYAQKPGMTGNSDDRENLAKLLQNMVGIPTERRGAAFVCSIAAILLPGPLVATRRLLTAEGRIEGRLTESPRGEAGFGYDPIFYVERFGKTTAELTAEEKNAISHRGQALRNMAEQVYGILTSL